MTTTRKIYERLPSRIDIPKGMKDHRVEVSLTDLEATSKAKTDGAKNPWPKGFFDNIFGALPDLEEREPQGNFEQRDQLR